MAIPLIVSIIVLFLPVSLGHQERFVLADVTNTTPRTTKPVPTGTSSHPSTSPGEVCQDKIDTCSHYGKQACTQQVYEAWARDKCAMYCGFCTPDISIVGRCLDRKGNCHEYDNGDLCTEPQFYVWAYENCKRYCKFDECNVTDCDDDPLFDCQQLDNAVSICADVQKARLVCKKLCNLCDIRDCAWNEWTQWSECQVTCGKGYRTRTRTTVPPIHGGLPCEGSYLESGPCTMEPCPIPGVWNMWNTWSDCSKNCGVGMQHRYRLCDDPRPSIAGNHCFGEAGQYKICVGKYCPNGTWTDWSGWSACDSNGHRIRDRVCSNPATPFMRLSSCPGGSQEEQVCNVYLANPIVHCVNACTNDVGGVRLCAGVNNNTCSPSHGRVEVFHNNTWGTVCDEGWNINAANVVCRMFGHRSGYYRTTSTYGSGTGPLVLANVTCLGTEPSLQQCVFPGWVRGDNSTCATGRDSAGVYCS